eukprot:2246834-Heterocapsa_arctica.AAC.1
MDLPNTKQHAQNICLRHLSKKTVFMISGYSPQVRQLCSEGDRRSAHEGSSRRSASGAGTAG